MTFLQQHATKLACRLLIFAGWPHIELILNPFDNDLVDVVIFSKNREAFERNSCPRPK